MDWPHKHAVPVYGAKIKYAKGADISAKLRPKDKLFIQQATGTVLYYARAVDTTILVALSAVAANQVFPTKETVRKPHSFSIT